MLAYHIATVKAGEARSPGALRARARLQLEAGAGGVLHLPPATSTVRLAPGSQPPPGDPDGPAPAPCARHNSAIHIRVARLQTQ
ncbi:ribonuclease P protein subunit p20-like [Alligator sinensis]|uniref:Ribonuclease P protein subunit p20-like n=1 Tax=Alligator sinensis TaxID=38654 RepID=A0A3Q0H472_ALLSI|nr:ribonuclease P protein subunit p20-like [Alligator sinensis]